MTTVPVVLGRRSAEAASPSTRSLSTPPGDPNVRTIRSAFGHHVFVADGSRLYDVDAAMFDEFRLLEAGGGRALTQRLAEVGVSDLDHITSGAPDERVDVRYLSLAVAQSCNLGCTYCYADGGDFGGVPAMMSPEVGRAAVARLLDDATPGGRVGVAFIGGEPLLNRSLVHGLTEWATAEGRRRGVEVAFSITTNGTLLRPDDVELFDRHGFAVTVSIDGDGELHDELRRTRGGEPTFERVIGRVEPLLARQGRLQVSARASITPGNLRISESVRSLIGRGFHSVGVAPVLRSPNGTGELDAEQLDVLLDELRLLTGDFLRALERGDRFPFSNLTSALQLIHRGAHRPHPCGAGGAYLGIGADGAASACHRFVGDDTGAMGSVDDGWDHAARDVWLSERHVDRQEPCRSCWARYLCGGGCHHEVIERGRTSCDFIRSWLEHCLATYVEVVTLHPDWFR